MRVNGAHKKESDPFQQKKKKKEKHSSTPLFKSTQLWRSHVSRPLLLGGRGSERQTHPRRTETYRLGKGREASHGMGRREEPPSPGARGAFWERGRRGELQPPIPRAPPPPWGGDRDAREGKKGGIPCGRAYLLSTGWL